MIIVAAALVMHERKILLARRRAGTHLAGFWEFPGGKLEPGETPAEAIVRELAEELGVRALDPRPCTFAHHRYPDREVLLLLLACGIEGTPRPLQVAAFDWFTVAAARSLAMADADLPLLDFVDRHWPGHT